MNIEHARSFLAVADTGSFVAAAERLHVTQSTISARIRTLEDTLGTTLFVRNKAGAVPTPSGVRFRAHAIKMVRAFERARREIRLPDNISYQIAIGARFGLWDDKTIDWIARQRRERSDLSVRDRQRRGSGQHVPGCRLVLHARRRVPALWEELRLHRNPLG